MNLTELKSEFKILFEDLATAGSKGLDDYEMSVCLTHAQEQIVRQLAQSGNHTPIAKLIKVHTETLAANSDYITAKQAAKVSNPFMELGYFATDGSKDIPANPVPQEVIDAMLTMPYKYPPKDLVYVVVGEDICIVFLPLTFAATDFKTRYVEQPTPVILTNLTGDTIGGLNTATEPILDASYHRELLNIAVQYAIQIYIGQPEQEAQNGG